jgi:hypothetical protein
MRINNKDISIEVELDKVVWLFWNLEEIKDDIVFVRFVPVLRIDCFL